MAAGGWGEPKGDVGALQGRALLEALGPLLDPARRVRYESPTSFADVSVDELDAAARSLKAIAYSCQEGARLLERVARGRRPSKPGSAAGEPSHHACEVTESPESRDVVLPADPSFRLVDADHVDAQVSE